MAPQAGAQMLMLLFNLFSSIFSVDCISQLGAVVDDPYPTQFLSYVTVM